MGGAEIVRRTEEIKKCIYLLAKIRCDNTKSSKKKKKFHAIVLKSEKFFNGISRPKIVFSRVYRGAERPLTWTHTDNGTRAGGGLVYLRNDFVLDPSRVLGDIREWCTLVKPSIPESPSSAPRLFPPRARYGSLSRDKASAALAADARFRAFARLRASRTKFKASRRNANEMRAASTRTTTAIVKYIARRIGRIEIPETTVCNVDHINKRGITETPRSSTGTSAAR